MSIFASHVLPYVENGNYDTQDSGIHGPLGSVQVVSGAHAASISDEIGIGKPLSPNEIQNLDRLTYVIVGCFAVHLSAVHKFVSSFASCAYSIVDYVDQNQSVKLWQGIASANVIWCDRLRELSTLCSAKI